MEVKGKLTKKEEQGTTVARNKAKSERLSQWFLSMIIFKVV